MYRSLHLRHKMIPPVSCGMINSNKFRIEINSVKIPFYKLKGRKEDSVFKSPPKNPANLVVNQNHNINQNFSLIRVLSTTNKNCQSLK